MLTTIKKLYRLQTSSLVTFQQKFGHYQGNHFYSVLHSNKCNGNIITLCLHLSTADLKTLFSDQQKKKNIKLIRTVKTN